MSESTTPIPAEAIEAAWSAYWAADRSGEGDVIAEALAAAAPVLLAAERERIAAAIEAKAADVAARSHLPADTKFRIGLSFSIAAEIARTTTEEAGHAPI